MPSCATTQAQNNYCGTYVAFVTPEDLKVNITFSTIISGWQGCSQTGAECDPAGPPFGLLGMIRSRISFDFFHNVPIRVRDEEAHGAGGGPRRTRRSDYSIFYFDLHMQDTFRTFPQERADEEAGDANLFRTNESLTFFILSLPNRH